MEHSHSLYLSLETGVEGHPYLYDRTIRYLNENCAVIYAVENRTNAVVQRLSRLDNRIEDFIERNVLVIASPASIYADRTAGKSSLSTVIKNMHRNPAGTVIVMGSPAESLSGTKLIEYEKSIGKQFNQPIEVVCCYNSNHQKRLSMSDIISLLIAHHYTIHTNEWHYSLWPVERIINTIKDEIDSVLGDGSGRLVLRTCHSLYGLDESEILRQPQQFEEKLQKLLGRSHLKIMKSILDRLRNEMLFEYRPI